MHGRFWIAALLPAVLLVATGCATKNWVRDVLGKVSAETDGKFAKVEGRVTDEAARVTAVEKSVETTGLATQRAQERADTAVTKSETAHSRADAAFTKAEDADNRLTRLWSKRFARSRVDSVEVNFAFDKADLNDSAQTALTALIKELQANPTLTVDLAGYADPTGKRDYNVTLSQRRVEAVRRFLVERGVELPRINFVGMGVLDDPKLPNAQKRRVTVNLMVTAD